MKAETLQKSPLWIAAFTLLHFLGEYLHNRYELPMLTLTSPENLYPLLVSIALFLGWWLTPYRKTFAVLLVLWAGLHLVGGGILSVIPFPFLPFYPEQAFRHYLAHLWYVLAQLPLMWALWPRRDDRPA